MGSLAHIPPTGTRYDITGTEDDEKDPQVFGKWSVLCLAAVCLHTLLTLRQLDNF